MAERGLLSKTDIHYMLEALHLAARGRGRTSPNPCVGAVIVNDNAIVGRGYHRKAGEEHAEVLALRQAGYRASGGVMYVTLEPCNHTGRTGPCSHAVAAAGIKKVIIGMLDPNPLVAGGGADYLRGRGIEIVSGLLEQKCRDLNRAFIKYTTTSLPLVIMKAGLSLDGRISYRERYGGSITGSDAAREVHRLRDRMDGILVGASTVEIDDPALTTRLEKKKGQDPVRIILDTTLRIRENVKLFTQHSAAPTWVFCSNKADAVKMERLRTSGVIVHTTEAGADGRVNLHEVLSVLGRHEISSLLVEGGATIHGAFLNARLVDRAHLFYAPIFAGDGGLPLIQGYRTEGGREQAVRLDGVKTRKCGDDLLITGDVVYP